MDADLYNQSSTHNDNVLTYGKYIKARLMGYDSRFRLHPVWTMWSYMQLENFKPLHVYIVDAASKHFAVQLLRQSQYTNQIIIDEISRYHYQHLYERVIPISKKKSTI